jgi:hypothetical protein
MFASASAAVALHHRVHMQPARLLCAPHHSACWPRAPAPTCSVMRCTAGDLLHTYSCSWLAGLMWALLMATSTPEAAWGGL